MSRRAIPITILPDIEMYSGDTEPWEVVMAHEDGRTYLYAETAGYSAVLTIMPYMYTAGIGVSGGSYILQKTASIQREGQYDAKAVFSFLSTDTATLKGKYTYQIEFTHSSDKRIGQGNLYIHNNINR